MATTESKSGFRLPWSSDRSHDAQTSEAASEAASETPTDAASGAPEAAAGDAEVAWPSSGLNDRLGLHSQPRPANAPDPATDDAPNADQEPEMINAEHAAPAPVAPKKPSKLMADLATAIRSTAQAAREQALAQVDADVAAVVEQIRTAAKDGEGTLRRTCDEDITGIKEWSRAEIARIKEETESKVAARKGALDGELEAHAAAIEGRVSQVMGAATGYRSDMDGYAASLDDEDDPSHLATMAESMPEPPAFEAWADLGDLDIQPIAAAVVVEDAVAPEAEAALDDGSSLETLVADGEFAAGDFEEVVLPAWAQPDAGWSQPDAIPEPETSPDAAAVAVAEVEAPEAAPEVEATAPEVEAAEAADGSRASAWADAEGTWAKGGRATGTESDADPSTGDGEPGDPVDRGAIMAALEAAAEAVVAAEAAAESANQAEVAADVAETAAELLVGRVDTDDETDPDAAAALSARVGAGGFEESYADRLAALLPSHAEGEGDGEPRTTQVVVSGLVSVASIASFKRHLGRLGGVSAVAVASGPDGEFVFNVTHRPDVSFRDALPTMPGFAARVTSSGDGVVQVTARDPESEG